MLIGVLSESHGSVPRTRAAALLLKKAGVRAVIHCGDMGQEAVLIEMASIFAPAQIPVYAVLGNVDLYHDALEQFPESAGVSVLGRFADLRLAGKRIAVVHGDDVRKLHALTHSGNFDYVFTGHTHVQDDTRCDRTRVINPGAVYRAAEPSAATLDLVTDELNFIPL